MIVQNDRLCAPLCGICFKEAEKPRLRIYSQKPCEAVVSICSEKCFQEYSKTFEYLKTPANPTPNKAKDYQVVDMEDIQI